MHQNDFPTNLIKGRIAEAVFELMFRESTDCEIYPLGYEHTTPILRQYRDHSEQPQVHKEILNKVLDNFDIAPDFLLTKPDKSAIYIVEVKYRRKYDQEEILSIAKEINEKWTPAHIFLATSEGFYYDPCNSIINSNGQISPLKESLIPTDKQTYYHDLLMRFEEK